MAGNLDLDTLKQEIAAGAIDTVLVCLVDMQGPADRQARDQALFPRCGGRRDACRQNLLAVDMQMEPVRGYQAAFWDQGCGYFAIETDIITLRRIPRIEGTAGEPALDQGCQGCKTRLGLRQHPTL